MTLGERILSLRKEKNINRDQLAKIVNTSGAIIGRYERNEATPSVEIARKIANALDVSLDYLSCNSDLMLSKDIINKIQDIQKLSDKEQEHIFALMNAFIKQAKMKAII